MNGLQHLLVKLAEEATEIAQIALKTAQFGFSEKKPGQELTNGERIHAELDDLNAVVRMLNLRCDFNYHPNEEAMLAKVVKVDSYKTYSQNLGLVES